MFDLGTIEVDPIKLRDGVWFEIWRNQDATIGGRPVAEPGDEKACVLVVPYGLAFDRVRDEERRPFFEKLNAGTVTDEEARAIHGRALARAVFRGLRNLSINGVQVVWSEAKAVELMTDLRWKHLREFVEAAAANRAATAAREEAQAKGN